MGIAIFLTLPIMVGKFYLVDSGFLRDSCHRTKVKGITWTPSLVWEGLHGAKGSCLITTTHL